MLLPGDFSPVFEAASSINPRFRFDTVAGRYLILSFFGSSQIASSRQFLKEMAARRERLDVTNIIFFGVSNDPQDEQRLTQEDLGRIYFYDSNLAISRKFGVLREDEGGGKLTLVRETFILDHALRMIARILMDNDEGEGAEEGSRIAREVDSIFELIDSMPRLQTLTTTAPVMIVPYVFEPELCRRLIDYYETHDAEDSGFMRDIDGKTVGVYDYLYKRRMDCEIRDEKLVLATQERIHRRIVPAIQQAYQFNVTRIERHIVACYDAKQGAHFRAHRDNTTLGTAHRRFAVTINLNSNEYEGGEIWFPEFGPRKFKAPSGAAIIVSCSLLHEVPKVTRGKRYAFLPFLYDDAAAAIRERNRKHLSGLSNAADGEVRNVCASANAEGKSGFSKVVIDGSVGRQSRRVQHLSQRANVRAWHPHSPSRG